ncbi:centrosomal protein of 164 kDa isoform X2 [Gouania willdenowi]|nr:centrosomal protein of 164 kDa isoform X2 [Gouania willdenowi]
MGDVYYFNFSSGQYTCDQQCDKFCRRLVEQEQEREHNQLTAPAGTKKEKKNNKEKKKKKEETPETLEALTSPLGGLLPLRGLDSQSPALRGSLGNSGGREPFKASLRDVPGSGSTSVLSSRQEELPNHQTSEKLLQNIHFDLGSLGEGLQYEVEP